MTSVSAIFRQMKDDLVGMDTEIQMTSISAIFRQMKDDLVGMGTDTDDINQCHLQADRG